MAITFDKDQYYLIFFFFILLICLISSKLYQQIFHKPTTHLNLPPSPPALPIIGHLHLLTSALYNSFFNLSSKYGPLLYLRLGAAHCLLVSSASMASEVFKTNDLAFSSRPLFTFTDKLPYDTSGFVTAPYGDYWRFMKKLCVTELLGVKQLERSRTIRREELRRLVAKVIKKATSKDQVLDVAMWVVS
ncbi:hypothetical protein LWI29_032968 [Acer saccharum]|uniref:Cytochrome P450 n=1 Tax=Acer saccharum TaxID=4024 RepID=A0AA39RIT1_ACESA|nr:hypothetical protein LWI29_032968 [Acer saccharum]